MHNYEGAIYGCSWCVAHRGGYEMTFMNTTLHNVAHIAHFKGGVGGIIIDGDGTLTATPTSPGVVGATIVPPTGQWKTNPNCTHHGGIYSLCQSGPVRRVNVAVNKVRLF